MHIHAHTYTHKHVFAMVMAHCLTYQMAHCLTHLAASCTELATVLHCVNAHWSREGLGPRRAGM